MADPWAEEAKSFKASGAPLPASRTAAPDDGWKIWTTAGGSNTTDYSAPGKNVTGGHTLSIPDSDTGLLASTGRFLQDRVNALGAGFRRMTEPGIDPKLGGASDVVREVGKAALPMAVPAMIRSPLRAGLTLLGGATGTAVGSIPRLLGAPEGTSEASETAGGLIGGGLTSRFAESPVGPRFGRAAVAGTRAGVEASPIVGKPLKAGTRAFRESWNASAPPTEAPAPEQIRSPSQSVRPTLIGPNQPDETPAGKLIELRNPENGNVYARMRPGNDGPQIKAPMLRRGFERANEGFEADVNAAQPIRPPMAPKLPSPAPEQPTPAQGVPAGRVATPGKGILASRAAVPALKPAEVAEYNAILKQSGFRTDPGDYPGAKRGASLQASFQANARGHVPPTALRTFKESQIPVFAANEGITPAQAYSRLKSLGWTIDRR